MTVVLESRRVRAEIEPDLGARLVSLRFDGHEVLGGADEASVAASPIGHGSYPMVPWAGRIRGGLIEHHGRVHQLPVDPDGNALHGLGLDRTWRHDGEGRFCVDLGAPWPVDGTARLVYTASDDAISCTLAWEAPSTPFCSLGFHPWFRRSIDGVEVVADLRPEQMVERGGDHLPTGRLVEPAEEPWDDCFTLRDPPRLSWPGVLNLVLESDAPWWVIYSEPTRALCVEPQSAPPDAFGHDGLRPATWPTSVSLTIRLG